MSKHSMAQHQKSTMPTFIPVSGGLLQRKCACGQHTVAGAECAECRKKRLQRKAAGHAVPETAPPIVHEVLRSPGQPLDAETRAFMEPRFGHDFSQVRLHTDAEAARAALAVHAQAFTVGQNIVFAPGQYAPAMSAGKQLLAHEIVHVLQQNDVRHHSSNISGISSPNDPLEREAERVAATVMGKGKSVKGVIPIATTPRRQLSRARFNVGSVTIQIDYGNVVHISANDYINVIETLFENWTGSQAATIHADLSSLSRNQQRWVLFGLDLIMDNPVSGLNKTEAVRRLITHAPAARFNPLADSLNHTYENEVLTVSGWFEKGLTASLRAPTGPRLRVVEQALNPNTATPGSSSCPSPRPSHRQLDATRLQNNLPSQLQIYLQSLAPGSNLRTQGMSDLRPIADLIQTVARSFFAPYVERARGNIFLNQWHYSANLVASHAPSAAPDQNKRLQYLDSRARLVGNRGLFAQVHFDSRCASDQAVLESIVQQMEQQANIQTLVNRILQQISYTERSPGSTRVVLSTQFDPTRRSDCFARWRTIETMCHELTHVLVHEDFRRQAGGRQIIREGFTEILGDQLYSHVRRRAGQNAAFKSRLEAGLSNSCQTIPAARSGYGSAGQRAERIRIVVGDQRFRAAYFLGQVHLLGIQPKLRVGQVDDYYEREANRMAALIEDTADMSAGDKVGPRISAVTAALEKNSRDRIGSTLPALNSVFNAPGRPLDPVIRTDMESHFGYDFSRVRIHTDSQVARSALAINASAYTLGNNIVFGKGQYAPETVAGRKLLAHELTHVLQQLPGIARDNGIIPAPELDVRGPLWERARTFEPSLPERRPVTPLETSSARRFRWRQAVSAAALERNRRHRARAFLRLINEAIAPDASRYPELRFPAERFTSERAARHGGIYFDANMAGQPEPSPPAPRADTRTHRTRGGEARVFIVIGPAALHREEGPLFTQRVLNHEYVHFLQNVRGELTARPACRGLWQGRVLGGNPNREVIAASTTFVRFFPSWTDGVRPDTTDFPDFITEDLGLIQAYFRCVTPEIQSDVIARLAATVRGHPQRRALLRRLTAYTRGRDVPDIHLSRHDDAMTRLSETIGAPLSRDPRLPPLPSRTREPLFDVRRFRERSRRRIRERMFELTP